MADISNLALLNRLRGCGDWLAVLVGCRLAAQARAASRGRLVRLIDATAVPKAGTAARRGNGIWRVRSAFDLPAERFAFFAVTDQRGGERLDRVAVAPGEVRVADRAYLQPDRIAAVLAAGGDVVVRAGWRNAAWLDTAGEPFDMIAMLIAMMCEGAEPGLIDRPIGFVAGAVPRRCRCAWSPSRNRRRPLKRLAARRGARRNGAGAASPRRPWQRPIG